jgi:hypothetical protein
MTMQESSKVRAAVVEMLRFYSAHRDEYGDEKREEAALYLVEAFAVDEDQEQLFLREEPLLPVNHR